MKEIKHTWRKDYKPLKLYKNDIETIVKIVKEYEQVETDEWKKKIYITADNFHLDDISELNEIKKDFIDYFNLSLAHSLDLQLSKYSANISVDDDKNTILMGIAHRIDNILQNRQRHFNFLFSYVGRVTFFLFLPISVCAFLICKYLGYNTYIIIPVCLAYSVYVGYKADYLPAQQTIIVMSNQSDVSSFYKRNKDKILVGISVSVITFLITLFIQWIVKKF